MDHDNLLSLLFAKQMAAAKESAAWSGDGTLSIFNNSRTIS
jgi:hypothetical protein